MSGIGGTAEALPGVNSTRTDYANEIGNTERHGENVVTSMYIDGPTLVKTSRQVPYNKYFVWPYNRSILNRAHKHRVSPRDPGHRDSFGNKPTSTVYDTWATTPRGNDNEGLQRRGSMPPRGHNAGELRYSDGPVVAADETNGIGNNAAYAANLILSETIPVTANGIGGKAVPMTASDIRLTIVVVFLD